LNNANTPSEIELRNNLVFAMVFFINHEKYKDEQSCDTYRTDILKKIDTIQDKPQTNDNQHDVLFNDLFNSTSASASALITA